jgi:hypothetical protein
MAFVQVATKMSLGADADVPRDASTEARTEKSVGFENGSGAVKGRLPRRRHMGTFASDLPSFPMPLGCGARL